MAALYPSAYDLETAARAAERPLNQLVKRLVGHRGTTTTATIYRKQIRPVLIEGTDAMDRIFPAPNPEA